MLAGPSEVLVIADETGDASTIAADLLAQARKTFALEHTYLTSGLSLHIAEF
jgi:histidinol dehydrogenase